MDYFRGSWSLSCKLLISSSWPFGHRRPPHVCTFVIYAQSHVYYCFMGWLPIPRSISCTCMLCSQVHESYYFWSDLEGFFHFFCVWCRHRPYNLLCNDSLSLLLSSLYNNSVDFKFSCKCYTFLLNINTPSNLLCNNVQRCETLLFLHFIALVPHNIP